MSPAKARRFFNMRDVPREVVFPELSRPIRAANQWPETRHCVQAGR